MTIAAVLISIAFLGFVSVLSMRADGEANAQKLMDVLCEEKCQQVNHYLESGEDIDAAVSGGDEFAVILKGEDLKSHSSLEELLAHRIGEINAVAENPWEKVSVAGGIVEYDPRVDADMESVLHRADEMMYEDKKRLKEERRHMNTKKYDILTCRELKRQ